MYKKIIKPALDFLIALIVFILLSPIFVVVTVGLWFANGGKPFFYQLRPGKGERIFKIIKFKTMNDRRDAKGQLLPDAERLTKIGTFVRKTSLDEIPQLLNVLKGDMSLIGPRPLLVKYLPYYSKREQLRHTVRPGITGLAQVNGRNKLNWDDRLELDAQYVENLSFLLDIKILFRTIVNVLLRKDIAVGYIDLDDYRKNRNE
ncbi:sugar transferase [Capnocytophaga genosp. AHN8471]|jgi:sugar transferase|uniref:Sugar transferase n=1 Tax=Capnocytophaga genosp. AHN8471 TaxID=327574 RepID=A0ABS1YUU8_9FLAO|nr:sugar transferase [Capnocytophaga genosp. AHN8471]MBM0650187.1 sugar transferase [Capnocytophaga genosp. AHN8471]MBM0662770.1 sugar transferase [Capnocytophaga genosp. AHN8471]